MDNTDIVVKIENEKGNRMSKDKGHLLDQHCKEKILSWIL